MLELGTQRSQNRTTQAMPARSSEHLELGSTMQASSPCALASNRTAVILAGGRSSRFGANKALQILARKPLICHVVERISNVVDDVLVVIGRGEPSAEYQIVLPSSVTVISDKQEGKNPLVGIVSGLQAAKSEQVAVLACDVPFVNGAVIDHLFRRARDADAGIPIWNAGRIEPLQAVYHRFSTLRAAQEALTREDSSQKEMIARLPKVVYVSVENEIRKIDPSLRTFFNVNTREDLTGAERIIRGQGHSDSRRYRGRKHAQD